MDSAISLLTKQLREYHGDEDDFERFTVFDFECF